MCLIKLIGWGLVSPLAGDDVCIRQDLKSIAADMQQARVDHIVCTLSISSGIHSKSYSASCR